MGTILAQIAAEKTNDREGFARMIKKAKAARTSQTKIGSSPKPDDFESVARRLGADEDKARFEAKIRKIAKAKPAPAPKKKD